MVQVYLVTGGWNNRMEFLSSTELLVAASSAWTEARALPSPRSYHRGVSINNHVIVTGECGDIKTLLTMQNKH